MTPGRPAWMLQATAAVPVIVVVAITCLLWVVGWLDCRERTRQYVRDRTDQAIAMIGQLMQDPGQQPPPEDRIPSGDGSVRRRQINGRGG